ncbi:MAG: hypothetical protein DRO87_04775 [Candidatus Thorarchaeota archaeon]|nr:MAG: hypothetical protein DRP09_12730 [Candidatus Thorarchaeota archaeon]RLI58781.1 MAG: hypothetical protein DRO87_04775 [Candidatus Thorarchaeota archaeon]
MDTSVLLFEKVLEYVDSAEESGQVDAGILEPLSGLRAVFQELQQHWLQEVPDSQLQDTFAMYHVARNCELILSRMIERFRKAPLIGDNPKVAEDTSTLLPLLIDSFMVMKAEIDYPTIESSIKGFSLARRLREVARMVDMLPSAEDEERDIPREIRKRGLAHLARNLAGMVSEEQGST